MGVKVRDDPPGSGVWFIFVNHKGKRFAKRVGTDKRVANQIAKEVERQLAKGDLGLLPKDEPKMPTFATYATGYLKNAAQTLKYSTWKDYSGTLRKHLTTPLGALPIDQVTRRHVKDLAFALRHGGLKPKTVRKIIGTLSVILGEACDDGLLSANPALQLKKVYRSEEFKGVARHINPLTHDELAHLLDTADTHTIERAGKVVHPYQPHRLFLLLLARTGVRLGEALAIKWGDIDLHGGFLEVQRNLVRGRVTTPKSGKARRVELSEQLRTTLALARQEQFGKVVALNADVQAERDAAAGVADTWVFPDATGDPMDPDNFRARVWDPLLTIAKLRKVRLHDLRHTYASLLLQDGTELLYVSQQLGHHSPAFTLAIYAHLLPKDRRGAVNRLDRPASIRKPDASDSSNAVLPPMKEAR